jgi:peptidoglycan hydrolase-like amidase
LRSSAAIALLVGCALAVAAHAADAAGPTLTVAETAPYLRGDIPILIGLAAHTNTVRITPRSPGRLQLFAGDQGLRVGAGQVIAITAGASGLKVARGAETWEAPGVEFAPDSPSGTFGFWASNGVAGAYRGSLRVAPDGAGRVTAINALPLEDYLLGVVGAEMSSGSPREALRAQAIVARTYALASLRGHAAQGFDLCATVHCQVYRGALRVPPRVAQAVQTTAGLAVARGEQIVTTFYHSTCGGISADADDVRWATGLPYRGARFDGAAADADLSADQAVRTFLASRTARFCRAAPRYRWRRNYTLAAAEALVARNLPIVLEQPGLQVGHLLDLAVSERAPSGRVHALDVVTDTGAYTVRQGDIRWLFGEGKASTGGLPSTLFVLDAARSADGRALRFSFAGAGWGHGIGLCQQGAQARARRGESAAQIIAAYYPTCQVVDARKAVGAQCLWHGVAHANGMAEPSYWAR